MGVLVYLLGSKAKEYSPHSWRVWIATAARMAKAPVPIMQALGRWLNPESLRIYARMSVVEYTTWIDKIMQFKTVDASRTTSLPVCDAGPVLGAWNNWLDKPVPKTKRGQHDAFDEAAQHHQDDSTVLAPKTRLRVFWTGLQKWYHATVISSRSASDENGATYRATKVLYDAADGWCTKHELTYTHCLEDIDWALAP